MIRTKAKRRPNRPSRAFRLAASASRLAGQPMFRLLAKAKELERRGKRILHFEIGEPDFDTPAHITRAAIRALKNGDTHYTSSMGTRELREAVARSLGRTHGFTPSLEQVLVTPANAAIYFAVRVLVNPGEEVIVPDPGFSTYYSVLDYTGARAVRVPLAERNAFRMNPADIERRITPHTRLIIINSPQNPTGAVMNRAEISAVARIAKRHNLFLLSDEIYRELTYGTPAPSPAPADRCRRRTLLLSGFSKAYAMTGWRLGYVVGPEPIIEKMGLLLQTILSCLPGFVQQAGIAALEGSQTPIRRMRGEYRRRRDLMVSGLNVLPGVTCLTPSGALYVFPNITATGMMSQEFADFMLDRAGVAVLAGSNFGPAGEGYVRLCYASSTATIREALTRMAQVLKNR